MIHLSFANFWPLARPKIGIQGVGGVEKLNLQAVIKSAASAASRNPRGASGRRPRRAPLDLGSLDLGFLEAALAADLITA